MQGDALDLEPWAPDDFASASRATKPGVANFANAHIGRDRSAWQRSLAIDAQGAVAEVEVGGDRVQAPHLQAGFGDRDQLRCVLPHIASSGTLQRRR